MAFVQPLDCASSSQREMQTDMVEIVSNPVSDGTIVLGDSSMSEWVGLDPVIVDPSGDGAYIDYYNLTLAHDSTYCYLLLHSLFSGSASETFTLYVDVDNSPETGQFIIKSGGGTLGADYKLQLQMWDGIFSWNGTEWSPVEELEFYGFAWPGEQYVEIGFSLQSLGAPQLMDLYLVDEWYHDDYAPNQGTSLYSLASVIIVPDDYLTIQEAIDAASEGDTVFVRNGTYYEHVVVSKTVSLVGENRETTIIDGSSSGRCIWVKSNDVALRGFTIRHGGVVNIKVSGFNGTLIKDNTLLDIESYWGISVSLSFNNTIEGNTFRNCGYGVFLESSSYNLIVGNTLVGNSYGIVLKTVAYIPELPPPPSSNFNTVHHNNFVNNGAQAVYSGYGNVWDDGSEGNFWSNYGGADLDGDGVGDTDIPCEGVDYYPLMKPFLWWNLADLNYDFTVDIYDLVTTADAYGSTPSDPHWNSHCDINEPYGIINIFDIVMIATSYGEEYTP